MHPLFEQADSITGDVINAAMEVQKYFGGGFPLGLVINFCDYRLGKRGIARVILKGADDDTPF